jgi:TolB-like protein
MMQHSVLITGQVVDTASGEETPLIARIWEVLDCEMLFDRPLGFDSPVLEKVSIRIDHTKWFDGIDFALQDSNAVQQQITENVRSSLRAVLPNTEDGL